MLLDLEIFTRQLNVFKKQNLCLWKECPAGFCVITGKHFHGIGMRKISLFAYPKHSGVGKSSCVYWINMGTISCSRRLHPSFFLGNYQLPTLLHPAELGWLDLKRN